MPSLVQGIVDMFMAGNSTRGKIFSVVLVRCYVCAPISPSVFEAAFTHSVDPMFSILDAWSFSVVANETLIDVIGEMIHAVTLSAACAAQQLIVTITI